jgi:hypothetical protein
MPDPEKPKHLSGSVKGTTSSSGQLTVTARHQLPADHPAYALIGRVTARWAQVEHALDEIIWELAGLDHETGSCITGQLSGYRGRIEVAYSLLIKRGMSKDTKRKLDKLIKSLQDPYDKRNRFVHDAWYM